MQHIPLPRKPVTAGFSAQDGVRWSCRLVLLICVGWISHAYAAGDAGVRCHVHLPSVVGGWNTVLAECDGSPVSIGPPTPVHDVMMAPGHGSEQYVQDLQAIRSVLGSKPTPTPAWVMLLAMLLGIALIVGLVRVGRDAYRRLSRIKLRRLPQAPIAPSSETAVIT